MTINWKKFFAILVILLIIGVIIAVAIVSIDKINILNKVP
jgi:hypothetical protein